MKYDPAPRRRTPIRIERIGDFEHVYDIMGAVVVLQTLGLYGSIDTLGVHHRVLRTIRLAILG